MPQTIEIGAFVLGAVLLLLALASGSVKIFGAELSGASNRLARVLAFALGLLFIGLGFWKSRDGAPGQVAARAGEPAPPTARAEAPREPPPPPPPAPGIAGTWTEPGGTVYEVVATGADSFRFVASNPEKNFQSQGTGTVRGLHVTSNYHTSLPSVGHGEGTLSADGQQLQGTFTDTALGTSTLVLRRQ